MYSMKSDKGKIIVIGDNFASYFSHTVIKAFQKNNTYF